MKKRRGKKKKKTVPSYIPPHRYHLDCRQLTQIEYEAWQEKKKPIVCLSKLIFQYLCFAPTETSPNSLVESVC